MAVTETLVAFVAVVGGSIAGTKAVLEQIESNGFKFKRGMKSFFPIYLGLIIGSSQMAIGLAILLSDRGSEFTLLEIMFFIDSVPIEISAIVIVSILLYMILSLEGFSTGIKKEAENEDEGEDDDYDDRQVA